MARTTGKSPRLVPPRVETHLPANGWIAMRTFAPAVDAPRHNVVHDHASIVLYLDGHASFWMGGRYALRAGDLLLVPAGAPHYAIEARGARAVGVSIRLDTMPGGAREPLRTIFDDVRRGGCAVRRFDRTETGRIEGLFREIDAELSGGAAFADLALDACVARLTVAMLRATEGPSFAHARASPIVSRALEHIHRRACAGISLRDVAKHVGRSSAHVASLVKEATGETVVGWITRARMSEGRRLLLHTDASTEIVAERCGFASTSHFHRAFKRLHGSAPGEWRRAQRI